METSRELTTQLLMDATRGSKSSLDRLVSVMYEALHDRAENYLRKERPDHTLQATALIHEVYVRLIDQAHVQPRDRSHFMAIASKKMREILVDYARRRSRKIRGADWKRTCFDGLAMRDGAESKTDIVALDEALVELEAYSPRMREIVELRFFGGLSIEEIAQVLKLDARTIKRDWKAARVLLLDLMRSEKE